MPSLAQSWNMLWEEPSEGRPVCTVVWNDLYINNAIIGLELEHAVGGAIRRGTGMYSCMEWFVYKQCHHWLRSGTCCRRTRWKRGLYVKLYGMICV